MTTLSEITERMIGGLHLTKIDKKGFHFTQGMNPAPGLIYKDEILYYLNRFDWESKQAIEKYLEKL